MTDGETDKKSDIQTNLKMERCTHRQMNKQMDGFDRKRDRHKWTMYKHTHIYIQTDRQTKREYMFFCKIEM